jgi:predicted ATPase
MKRVTGLTRASFRNFKLLAEVNVELEPLTVFVGANGSGKTSLLEGIFYCQTMARPVPNESGFPNRPAAYFAQAGDPNRLTTLGKSDGWSVQIEGPKRTLSLTLETAGQPYVRLDYDGDAFGAHPNIRLDRGNGQWAAALDHMAGLGVVRRLAFEPARIAMPSASGVDPSVGIDGSNVASVLSEMLGRRDPAVEAIERDLAKIVPGAGRLFVRPTEIVRAEQETITVGGETKLFDRSRTVPAHRFELQVHGRTVPADLLSEGTLLAVALLTIVHGPDRPQLLLIDDLDKALHFTAQYELLQALRRIQEEHEDLQILATSHSPDLLDALSPNEVRVMALRDGVALCRKLTDHPRWTEWQPSLRPGEFWGTVGEDWVGA